MPSLQIRKATPWAHHDMSAARNMLLLPQRYSDHHIIPTWHKLRLALCSLQSTDGDYDCKLPRPYLGMAHRCDTSPAAASTAAALKYSAVLDLRLWIVPPGKAALVPRRRAQISTPEHAVPATAAYKAGRVWGRCLQVMSPGLNPLRQRAGWVDFDLKCSGGITKFLLQAVLAVDNVNEALGVSMGHTQNLSPSFIVRCYPLLRGANMTSTVTVLLQLPLALSSAPATEEQTACAHHL